MKKLLLTLCLFSITAHAEEIKLQCNVTGKFTYSNGESERESGTAIIDIQTTPNLYIRSSSSADMFDNISFLAINTDNNNYKSSFINNSNSSKWEISNVYSDKVKNLVSNDRIIIDRNTGSLFYRRSFTSSSNKTSITEVSGTCSKVDTTKRKF